MAKDRLFQVLTLHATDREIEDLDSLLALVPVCTRHAITRAAFRRGLKALSKEPSGLVAEIVEQKAALRRNQTR